MNHQPVDATTANSFLPKVSVVVPIYNGEADLPELINCLLSQTYPKDSPITIHPLSENHIQSSYAARNIGIRAAVGEIVAFTDADCRPQPQWLEALIQPFVNSKIVIVAGEIAALPGKTLLEQHADRQETLSQKHTLAHSFCPYGQTANLAIRRIALEKAGLFRPHLTTGGDADICWRILQQNIGLLEFAPNAIVQHRHRATFQELKSQWWRYGKSNRYLHELHGVDLMREITLRECGYRLVRWLLKEVPRDIASKAAFIDLFNTPIGLFTARARAAGQRDAKLPENAKIIEWL